MKALETEIRTPERLYRQIKREGPVALYAVYGYRDIFIGYEVIRIQILRAGTIYGRFYPEREAYPPSSDWGKSGWSFPIKGRDRAEERFAFLVEREKTGARSLKLGFKSAPAAESIEQSGFNSDTLCKRTSKRKELAAK